MAVSTLSARADHWPARAGHLASLTSADALGIIVVGSSGKPVSFARHNLIETRDAHELEAGDLPIQLADGRAAAYRFAAPLLWNDRPFGALVGLRVDRAWDALGQEALTRATGLVAVDLAETYSSWEWTRAAAALDVRVRALEEFRREIARADDPETMIALAAKRVGELFDASGVSVMILEHDDQLVVRSVFGGREQLVRDARRRVGEGISGWVAKHGEPLILSGRVVDARFTGVDPTIEEAHIVPLRTASRVLGVVNVRSRPGGATSDPDRLRDLNIVASDLAAMIERAETAVARLEMLRALEDDRRQALALFDLARLAGIGSDPQGDIEAAAALVAHAFRHEVVGIWTPDEDSRRLVLRGSFGYGEVLPGDVLLDGDEFAEAAIGERRPRRVHGARARAWMSAQAESYLLVPITVPDSGNGLLVLGRGRDPYREIELPLSMTIADFLSSLAQREMAARLLMESKAERRRVVDEMQRDFAAQLSRVVMVLDLCQRLLRKDPDLPTQLATAAREARSFLGRFGEYVAGLQDEGPQALAESLSMVSADAAAAGRLAPPAQEPSSV